MTKRQLNVWAFAAAAIVFYYYLSLLNIDLTSDAQAGIAYLFYGPPGLVPSFFAFASVKTLPAIWQNRANPSASIPSIIIGSICAALVIGPLIYTSIRFAVN